MTLNLLGLMRLVSQTMSKIPGLQELPTSLEYENIQYELPIRNYQAEADVIDLNLVSR